MIVPNVLSVVHEQGHCLSSYWLNHLEKTPFAVNESKADRKAKSELISHMFSMQDLPHRPKRDAMAWENELTKRQIAKIRERYRRTNLPISVLRHKRELEQA